MGYEKLRKTIAEYETKIESLRIALDILEGEATARKNGKGPAMLRRAIEIDTTRRGTWGGKREKKAKKGKKGKGHPHGPIGRPSKFPEAGTHFRKVIEVLANSAGPLTTGDIRSGIKGKKQSGGAHSGTVSHLAQRGWIEVAGQDQTGRSLYRITAEGARGLEAAEKK